MECKKIILSDMDGLFFGTHCKNYFYRVLLDAPCSGLGVTDRDPLVNIKSTVKGIQQCAYLQKELLIAAIDAVNYKRNFSHSILVYSTCSIIVEENEEVVNYVLTKRNIKIVNCDWNSFCMGYFHH